MEAALIIGGLYMAMHSISNTRRRGGGNINLTEESFKVRGQESVPMVYRTVNKGWGRSGRVTELA